MKLRSNLLPGGGCFCNGPRSILQLSDDDSNHALVVDVPSALVSCGIFLNAILDSSSLIALLLYQ
jgi:hypothetical protein